METIHPVGNVNDYEKEILNAMKPELIASIEKVRRSCCRQCWLCMGATLNAAAVPLLRAPVAAWLGVAVVAHALVGRGVCMG